MADVDPRPESHPELGASARRVVAAAATHDLAIEVVEFPDGTRTAADAAAAVGCELDQIVKSMVFDAGGEVILALTPGSRKVDGAALAALAGVGDCGRADADRVRETTGFAIGGVAPIGHLQPVRTWIDPRLFDFEVVWAAAGTPRHVFAIDPAALAEVTGAIRAPFTD